MDAHASLPDDINQLRQQLLSAHTLLEDQRETILTYQRDLRYKDIEIICLQEKLRLLIHKRFGASAEASLPQFRLFDEAEAEALQTVSADAATDTVAVPAHQRKRGRKALPAELPRLEVIHDLPEARKICPHDGAALKCIGDEVSEQLDIIPATIQVLRHIRKKYACPCCEQHIVTAELPKQPIPKSLASPGTLAFVAVSKYADGLPLYRQQVIFDRLGCELPRATLCNWMLDCGQIIQPLINLLNDRLLAQPLIHLDETVVQVLNEDGKPAQSQSYMWVRAAGPPDQEIILFEYDPSRSKAVPPRLLPEYHGAILVDGYEGYDHVCQTQSLTRLGCWAHARRKFVEAQRAAGKHTSAKAEYALKLIGKLYQLEKILNEVDADERHRRRRETAQPVLDKLHVWLQQTVPAVPPQTALGKALHYLHAQWERLTGYMENGNYPIDNNRAENAIRPFAVGRKNWLFSNSVAGVKASANLYSLIETAKANGVEPYQYLRYVFTELPKAATVEDIEAVLPWACREKLYNVKTG
jgi:transposase